MKKEYNIKDRVWIHIGEKTLIEGRVVEIINFGHLNEGHSKDREYYVIELKTGIEDIYEVRSYSEISSTEQGPINLFKNNSELVKNNRYLKKVGIPIPVPDTTLFDLLDDESDNPTTNEIHAALEKSQQNLIHGPLIIKESKSKPKQFVKRKPKK
jgi:hypothetical protein